MNQIQCPNCGGYKVNEQRHHRVDRRTGKRLRLFERVSWGQVTILLLLNLCAGPFFALFGLFMLSSQQVSIQERLGVAIFFFVLALLGFITAVAMVILTILEVPKLRFAKHVYQSQCILCGYQWTWSPGEAQPEVRPNSRLIQLGEEQQRRWD